MERGGRGSLGKINLSTGGGTPELGAYCWTIGCKPLDYGGGPQD